MFERIDGVQSDAENILRGNRGVVGGIWQGWECAWLLVEFRSPAIGEEHRIDGNGDIEQCGSGNRSEAEPGDLVQQSGSGETKQEFVEL